MTGLCWTYEDLCDFIRQLSSSSSSPTSAIDLNPIIKHLLTICPNSSIFDIGGHSVLLSITEHIAAKVSLKSGDTHLRHEQTIFQLLDRAPCPYIIQSFFRGPDVTFMQLLRNGTLHQRMTMLNKPRHVLPWIQQLSDAVACKIGDDLEVGYEPYVRFHRRGTANGGMYGIAGPITEQFALGSIFWYITRGAELYADLEGPEQVNCLMDGKFPVTDPQDPIDSIISDCWLGNFQSIADLSKHIRKVAAFNKTYQEREKTCAQFYQLLSDPSRQEYTSILVDDQPCTLDILDTGWDYRQGFGNQWIKRGEGFVLVYSVTSRESFQLIRELQSQVQKEKKSSGTGFPTEIRYLNSSRLGKVPVMIVGCKSDKKERAVSCGEGSALAKELGCKFSEVSAKSHHDVENVFYDVVRWLRWQRQQCSETWHDRGDPRLFTESVGGSTLFTEDKRNCRFYLTAFSAIRQFFTRLYS